MTKSEKSLEFKNCLIALRLSSSNIADILGMSSTGVDYWIREKREVPDHVVKLMRLFVRNPNLLNEFY